MMRRTTHRRVATQCTYTPRPRTPAPALGLVSSLQLGVETTRVMPKPAPKSVRHESEAWRRAVAALPCSLCGKHDEIQCAHRNEGKGMALKTDDCLTAALCVTCHRYIDQGRDMSRDERRRLMDTAILLTVRELARLGALHIKKV